MKKILLIILSIFISSANAEVIKEIEIIGNKRISSETIKVYGEIELNKDYSNSQLNEISKNIFATNYFENVELNLTNGLLKIFLKEYQVINDVTLEGEKTTKLKKAILERLTLQANSSFIKSQLADDIQQIKKVYGSFGFNFVKVDAKIEQFSSNRVNLVFDIDKGQKTKISNINFIGDKKIRDRRLRDLIVSEEDKFWKFISKNTNLSNINIELDKRLLKKYYKSIGYYDVQILTSSAEVEKNNKTSLTFNIDAGNRYKINKITTNIDPVYDKKLFFPLQKEFNKRIGKYYSPFHIKQLLEELDLLIDDNDLQFVEHTVNEIVGDKTIEIKLNIFEGQKLLVERIDIKGNTITNESVIRAELLLDEGDPFNKLKLKQSISELKSRNLFANVKQNITDGTAKDLKTITITVEEKATGEISAGAGVGTTGGSFQFSVVENNWMGKGIAVDTFANISKSAFEGGIDFINPNHNFTGNALTYGLSTQTLKRANAGYENDQYSAKIGTGFEQYKDTFIYPTVKLTLEDLSADTTASAAIKKQAGSFTDLTLDYAVNYDKRNRSFKPTSGFISSFNQTLPIYADTPYLRDTYRISGYKPFGEDIVTSAKFYASHVLGFSDDVRISKRISVPAKRIRGFKQGKIGPKDGSDYVGGNYAAALSLEANLPKLLPEAARTDIGMFVDVANLWGVDYSNSVEDSNKIRSSLGTYISWTSPVGPMSFILSQNITKASTDQTETFNFKLGTTF